MPGICSVEQWQISLARMNLQKWDVNEWSERWGQVDIGKRWNLKLMMRNLNLIENQLGPMEVFRERDGHNQSNSEVPQASSLSSPHQHSNTSKHGGDLWPFCGHVKGFFDDTFVVSHLQKGNK